MEVPPLSTAAANTVAIVDAVNINSRSSLMESPEAESQLLQPAKKLRLTCSYGGHIVLRPHDKTLCYVGGETRIVVVDRHISLADLLQRLSRNFLRNESFFLKYQLPSEDLDSLISVATDEDLENMVEEYDRISRGGGGLKLDRLRIFLFPKSASRLEHLLFETESIKSEDYFFDALNGKTTGAFSSGSDRELKESLSVNSLLGLHNACVDNATVAEKDVNFQSEAAIKIARSDDGNCNGNCVENNHDVRTVLDSPLPESTSSFGGASISAVSKNLPAVRLQMKDSEKVGLLGMEDQFQQLSLAIGDAIPGNANLLPLLSEKADEIGNFIATGVATGAILPGHPVVAVGDANRSYPINDRSDHGGQRVAQEVQQQVQQPQLQMPLLQKNLSCVSDSHSPDSDVGGHRNSVVQPQVQQSQMPTPLLQKNLSGTSDSHNQDSASSEGCRTNTLIMQRQAIHQEQPVMLVHPGNAQMSSISHEIKAGDQNNSQFPDPGYVISGQFEQNRSQLHQMPHFFQSNGQFIPSGPVPMASYYPMYPSVQQHHPQQPIYLFSARQNQSYSLPLQQSSYSELALTASALQQAHPPAYDQSRNASSSQKEMPDGVYEIGAHTPVQQARYIGFNQVYHQPSQSMAHTQMYYSPLPSQMSAQFHTLTSAPGIGAPNTASQLPESIMQLVKSSEP